METASRNYDWCTDYSDTANEQPFSARKMHFLFDRVRHNIVMIQVTLTKLKFFKKTDQNRDQTNKPDKRSWGASSHIIQHSCMKVKIALISCAGIQIHSTPSRTFNINSFHCLRHNSHYYSVDCVAFILPPIHQFIDSFLSVPAIVIVVKLL